MINRGDIHQLNASCETMQSIKFTVEMTGDLGLLVNNIICVFLHQADDLDPAMKDQFLREMGACGHNIEALNLFVDKLKSEVDLSTRVEK